MYTFWIRNEFYTFWAVQNFHFVHDFNSVWIQTPLWLFAGGHRGRD